MKSSLLNQHLDFLKLPYLRQHHVEFAQQAAERHWDHVDYLRRLIEGQYTERRQRLVDRRLKAARFPVLKTLEQYQCDSKCKHVIFEGGRAKACEKYSNMLCEVVLTAV